MAALFADFINISRYVVTVFKQWALCYSRDQEDNMCVGFRFKLFYVWDTSR